MRYIERAGALIGNEAWVVPLTPEGSPDKIPALVLNLSKRYEAEYIRQWKAFFADIEVRSPTETKEAVDLLPDRVDDALPAREVGRAP